jgi:hypothetical protein
MKPKDRFKKVTSIFLLGVTLVLGASALTSSKAEAAAPWNNQGSDGTAGQRKPAKPLKNARRKSRRSGKQKPGKDGKWKAKEPQETSACPAERNHQPDQRPESMPWKR